MFGIEKDGRHSFLNALRRLLPQRRPKNLGNKSRRHRLSSNSRRFITLTAPLYIFLIIAPSASVFGLASSIAGEVKQKEIKHKDLLLLFRCKSASAQEIDFYLDKNSADAPPQAVRYQVWVGAKYYQTYTHAMEFTDDGTLESGFALQLVSANGIANLSYYETRYEGVPATGILSIRWKRQSKNIRCSPRTIEIVTSDWLPNKDIDAPEGVNIWQLSELNLALRSKGDFSTKK